MQKTYYQQYQDLLPIHLPSDQPVKATLSAVASCSLIDHPLRRQVLQQYQILDTEPEPAFDDITQIAAQVCQTPIALVSLSDTNRQWFKAKVGLTLTEVPRERSFCNYAIQQPNLFIVPDASVDPRFVDSPLVTESPKLQFYAGMPLLNSDGIALGVLCVLDYQPRQLTTEQQQILQLLARQVTTLLESRRHSITSAQLATELGERTQLSTLSTEVAAALAHAGRLPEILDHCLQAIAQYPGFASVRLWTFNQKANLLELQAIAGQHSHTDEFHSRIPLGISIIGFIAQNRTAYLSNTATDDFVIGAKEWLQQEGITAFAGYPLVLEDQLIGVMALFSRQPFTAAAQTVLESLAHSIAMAIDRTWAREALLDSREALLFRLANQIRNSLDLDTILGKAVNEIRALLQIDRCHFLWCWSDPNQSVLAITHESKLPELPSLVGECPEEQAVTLSEQVLSLSLIRIDHVATAVNLNHTTRTVLQDLGITSQLLLPVETRSGQLGAIMCSHSSGARSWSDREVELLQAVVDQIAIAIDQAELYAQTRAAAFAAQTQAQQLSQALQNLKQTQSQLIQSEKMSSLGQMVAGIAHEINNPVNFITGNLTHASNYIQDLLQLIDLYHQHIPETFPEIQACEEDIDIEFVAEDLPKLLSSMMSGAERIRQIVLSLRNFSRLDEAEMKPVDIHEGIDSTLLILQSRLKPMVNSPTIQVIKEYGNLPKVECYAGQLNQVFMNVLANAIEALDEARADTQLSQDPALFPNSELAEPKIWIQTELLNADRVRISIRDNGIGMTEEVRKHLFDPFFTTKPVGKGTGLGLSISYQIVVEKHGGSFECLSELGQGAEFRLEIPIKPVCSRSRTV
ncbi:GAF domain-containing protein [Pantanalinema sp. GBBB05]|uniref:GAF domain-containing protein n=1 Tax=Pantanalinema sp. GBBB05 TaxID=2604139 RepID=UPI001D401E27|nr:GAF domain-containing protein [Pantanalinema sp. GBBB05]